LAEPAIRLRNVHLTLGSGRSAVHVLKDVGLAVDRGESVGIVGPSGSGKSTLLMVVAGLERADEGFVEIAGQSLAGLSEDELAAFRGRNIGIVFQSFHLIPNMTALENVAVPLELAGLVEQIFARARVSYGGDAWSPMVCRLLEDACGTDLRAPGFPSELEPV